MMSKRLLLILIMVISCNVLSAQINKNDSLQAAWKKNGQDSTLVELLINKGIFYRGIHPDSGMLCVKKSLALARKINYKKGVTGSLDILSLYYFDSGDLAQSMKLAFELLPQARAINDQVNIWGSYTLLGLDYYMLQDYNKAIANSRTGLNVALDHRLYYQADVSYNNLCLFYMDRQMPDSATYFYRKLLGLKTYMEKSDVLFLESGLALLKGDYAGTINAEKRSIQLAAGEKNYNTLSTGYLNMAEAYQKLSMPDSGLFYAKRAFDYAIKGKRPFRTIQSAGFLSDYYRKLNDYKNAFYYQQVTLQAKDSLYNQRKALQVQSVTEEEAQRKRSAETAEEAYRTNVRLFSLLGVLAVFIVVASILLYNNRRRKKANLLLSEQKREVQNTLDLLKATQTQLIQSEKMASLGELTAGIAHEIQNPLNFVNNFSDVNTELIDEIRLEIEKGDLQEIKAIAIDIQENEKKINMHGKRADAIVKGMLQHSRTGTGEKQPTDLNALAEEYLRLSYHGLRAKDKDFNAELATNLNANLPKANIVQQDISRVLLNLFNNAFYAVNDKKKTAGAGYKPEVSVTTLSENGRVVIKVKDNGNGIPDGIKDKIMQPFFTTKPTGEGTGLGLSLSYDIVVKGHGGSINVDTKEGEFTEFIVTLPI
jgi:signal transduction histidine kinase